MNVLDIFSGIGGFSYGLSKSSPVYNIKAFCEVDKDARHILKKHHNDIPIYENIINLSGKSLNDIDLICGGFPCQDISIAGKKVGIYGKKSGLWSEYYRLIKELKPSYCIIENVANLRKIGLSKVLYDINSLGYDAEWHIIPASAIGALHRRERIWIIVYKSTTDNIYITEDNIKNYHKNKNYWKNNFKDSVTFEKMSEQHDKRLIQLGNAIVPQMAEFIGNLLLAPPSGKYVVKHKEDIEKYKIDIKPLKGRSGIIKNNTHFIIEPSAKLDKTRDMGLYPTPTCRDASVRKARPPEKMIRKDCRNVLRQPGLAEMAFQPKDFPITKETTLINENLFTKSIKKQKLFKNAAPGFLNPNFVEWLMGFPEEYTKK